MKKKILEQIDLLEIMKFIDLDLEDLQQIIVELIDDIVYLIKMRFINPYVCKNPFVFLFDDNKLFFYVVKGKKEVYKKEIKIF